MTGRRRSLFLLLSLTLVNLSGLNLQSSSAQAVLPAPPAPAATCTDAGTRRVGVSGNMFTLNGQPWLPRGLGLRALVSSARVARNNAAAARGTTKASSGTWQNTLDAQASFGPAEFEAARSWHADTLRFQVSQPSLDPQNTERDAQGQPLYDPAYRQQVLRFVNEARCAGFIVLLSMQDERLTGTEDHHNLPTADTLRAWQQLLPALGNAPDVMLEVYNEPSLRSTPDNWTRWAYAGDQGKAAGTKPGPRRQADPDGAMGMRPLVLALRQSGAHNLLVLDGLGLAATLEGLKSLSQPIVDPLDLLAYAVHPYPRGEAKMNDDLQFGQAARQVPVLVTEWSAGAGGDGLGLRNLPTPQPGVDLLNYLAAHHLPLIAAAFDIPGVMAEDVPGWTPTNYDNYAQAQGNAGLLVRTLFLSDYTRRLTLADGLTR